MSARRRWLTAGNPGSAVCCPVFVPGGDAYRAAFLGAYRQLCEAWNWEHDGDATPEEVAAAFEAAFWKTAHGGCMYVGTVFWFAGADNPPHCLDCDGAALARAEYTELFGVIGVVFGAPDTDHFNLPDIEGRFIRSTGSDGSGGADALGNIGGAAKVALTGAQMPEHDHTVHAHLSGLAVAPGELAVSVPDPAQGVTGDAGGGEAHENRPPFIALRALIRAR